MANFHPSDNTLIEYSAGNLPAALAICVAAHLEYCPQCSHRASQLNSLGGTLLETSAKAQVASTSFTQLMARIQAAPTMGDIKAPVATATKTSAKPNLPKVINKLIHPARPLKWKRVSPALKEAIVTVGQDQYEVCFHRIKRGGKVAEHDHGGTEITVVLEGSFSDELGTYTVGDYIEKQPGDIHRPMATQNEDCLCLSVSEAPVKITGLLGKLINPFISFAPR
ncbi:ChrR family anti-sigma-E factor [Saccharophagus degradans]|uniref:Anti-sigma factor ChrR, putative n=1 Tax=Saccharophagus degradans (strain 2-40 / ATCC 43961 / DSM 17024) TaxID=203122 RepID=Q21HU7_SACD2|nr:ChrR family anti-sigma-E factor [Saccharophagus degradans]ABD81732.1 Anti-sigma factor ChrR, putative [Saccharophagus degradans 2-40]